MNSLCCTKHDIRESIFSRRQMEVAAIAMEAGESVREYARNNALPMDIAEARYAEVRRMTQESETPSQRALRKSFERLENEAGDKTVFSASIAGKRQK